MANLNLNKVILAGRLTSDVELKATQSGTQYVNFNIAVNRPGKDGGVDFISVIAWRQRAEFISRYFKKGSSICIFGSIQTRTWTDNQGNKRYATDVVADEVYFVDSKDKGQASAQEQNTYIPDSYLSSAPKFEEVGDGEDEQLPF